MNRRRVGELILAAIVILVIGVVIGSRLSVHSGTAAPGTTVVHSTIAPTAALVSTPTTVPVPKGLGIWYYQSSSQTSGTIGLHYVGRLVVAHVAYPIGVTDPADIQKIKQGKWPYGTDVFTGTLTGQTLTAQERQPNNPSMFNKLLMRVDHPGEAIVTLAVGGDTHHFVAICGLPTDSYRYQNCQALTKS